MEAYMAYEIGLCIRVCIIRIRRQEEGEKKL